MGPTWYEMIHESYFKQHLLHFGLKGMVSMQVARLKETLVGLELIQ